MARLSVDLNRDGLHQIAAPSSFETDGPFEIQLRNHGEAVHVHLNLDDELSAAASLDESNHYVEPYSRRSVPIDTARISTAVTGRLKVVTAYGAESAYTTITVSPPGTVTNRVIVDEQLAKPQRSEPVSSSPLEELRAMTFEEFSSPVVGLGAVGIALVILAVANSSPLVAGSLAIIVGVIALLALTYRPENE